MCAMKSFTIRREFSNHLISIKRLFMWHYLNNDLVLVSEYPKCGGTWFCNMLHEAIELPFYRNTFPKLGPSVMQGHYLYSDNFGKMIGVIRDGRDVMVSAYYYYLFNNEYHSLRHLFDKDLSFKDYNDVEENLPKFIEHLFTKYDKRRLRFTWSESISSFFEHSDRVHIVKYENLLHQAKKELREAIEFLNREILDERKLDDIILKYSFENQTKRRAGDENKNSFLRKGISGDWKNKFTNEACEVFDYYGGEELITAGYEKDRKWY